MFDRQCQSVELQVVGWAVLLVTRTVGPEGELTLDKLTMSHRAVRDPMAGAEDGPSAPVPDFGVSVIERFMPAEWLTAIPYLPDEPVECLTLCDGLFDKRFKRPKAVR